jgi:hypothetical protein
VPLPRVASGRLGRSRVGCDRNQPFRFECFSLSPEGRAARKLSTVTSCQRGKSGEVNRHERKSHYAWRPLFVKPGVSERAARTLRQPRFFVVRGCIVASGASKGLPPLRHGRVTIPPSARDAREGGPCDGWSGVSRAPLPPHGPNGTVGVWFFGMRLAQTESDVLRHGQIR